MKSKKQLRSDNSFKSNTVALQLEDDVPDFPRGGRSSLSRQERDEIFTEVDREFATKVQESKTLRKRKTMSKNIYAPDDDLGSLFGDGIAGKLPRYANRITLKNISPGMKLWGLVAEVNEKDIVVCLPGGLRGYVSALDAFDPIFDDEIEVGSVFSVGQLVSCVVLRLDDDKKESGKRKIWLSLRLSLLHKSFTLDLIQEGMVLTTYVKSIEDHGFILHFGVSSFTGFLPENSLEERRGIELSTGQLLQGVVRNIDKTRKVVYMSSDPDTMSKCVTKDVKGMSMDLLVPGMMVNARVKSILENGVMLTFLTYFTGTVDLFHLQNTFPTSKWKDGFNDAKKVYARILFIDPLSRAVGLTLNPYLVQNKAPSSLVKIGDIYDESKVVRVDRGLGLLLEIPSAPVSSPAYVSIYDVAEDVRKLEKMYKEGDCVRVRIHGLKHLEGLATGTLKASAFEGSVFTHADVKPGMLVRAKIINVDGFGAIVQIRGGLKALCPLQHMSELDIAKPGKKFKVGAELLFRVLGCKSKRITVTHKKTLVKSKLAIISSYSDASDGLITHGWIAKVEKYGCLIRFYNGVQGFVPRSEIGLEAGSDPSSMYNVGQVVKCRVVGSIPASRRINLSFVIKSTRAIEDDMVKLGSIVSGVVDRLTPNAVIVHVNAIGFSKGTIFNEHLADHRGHAALLKSKLKPGFKFERLLILDIEGNSLLLSAKDSLIRSASLLPSDISQIHPNSAVHGYICNMIESGCFVRFLGRLTGFAPQNKAIDGHMIDLSEAFYIGQSVRSYILDVNRETNRITISLKPSMCSSTDASLLEEYFLMEDKIAKLQYLDSEESECQWSEGFNIGSLVDGKIEKVEDAGVVISFEKYHDVFGFIAQHQLGGSAVENGSTIQAVVLDVSKAERIVELSLKPELVCRSKDRRSISRDHKKKRKQEAMNNLLMHQTVKATIEIVKENYLVVSLPEHSYAIGYGSIYDYNSQILPKKQFLHGQSVVATVMALPSSETSGKLLLFFSEVSETSNSKKAKKKFGYKVGSLVTAEITEIRPLELKVKFGTGLNGRVHITEVDDNNYLENPLSEFRVGQIVTARVVVDSNKSSSLCELSVRPKLSSGTYELEDKCMSDNLEFSIGQRVTGFVYKVDGDWVRLTVSRSMRAQIYILDSSCEPSDLKNFQNRFHVGKSISGHVLSINKEKKLLRLVLCPVSIPSEIDAPEKGVNLDNRHIGISNEKVSAYMHEGDIVGGKISNILPGVGGLHVQVGPHIYGKVHYTELADSWVPDPLSGYCEGQFVKCKILEINGNVNGKVHVDLSLCSLNLSQNSTGICSNDCSLSKNVQRIEDLRPGMAVEGYVKNVSTKGCFILLSRKIDAKILLSNLSDGYVKDPEKEFPVGKLITGKVLSVEPLSNRVEVTLRTNASNETSNFSSLHVGDIISGRIRRVESYGLFIAIDNTCMVGLCHVSEISDDGIDDIQIKYKAGEKVEARVLKVDEERQRISLGMKYSYMRDNFNTEVLLKQDSEGLLAHNDVENNVKSSAFMTSNLLGDQSMDIHDESGSYPVLVQAEARASVPPLEVTLEDFDQSDMDNVERASEADDVEEKNKRQAKKKAKEDREREIRAAEERLLENDMPRTADEFEKLVRSSPNSSFIWIKYMAFLLSMDDVEKARSIAERALQTMNIREENEKLNIWVAYFNLENEYGNPSEEAVKKVFQRALQYNDPKNVHLALLGMYERTGQQKLADELIEKMTRKFKHSCKVWLRRVQRLLVDQNDDKIHSVVQRALLTLPKHKHIKFISHSAILEFKIGVPGRARTMFEGILREYPKRTDLWSIYIDQEIRLGDADVIRALLERATTLSLPPKKMKFLFKKYLDYEKSQGDEERIEYVKQKAMEYVESTLT